MNSRKIFIGFFFLAISFTPFLKGENLIQNVTARQGLSLDGKWHYIIDPYETGYYDYRYKPYDQQKHPGNGAFFLDKTVGPTELIEYNFDKSPTLMVPGDWNSQDNKLLYYEGTIWYRKKFDYKKSNPNDRVFVYFGAVNYESDVYLNGKKLGKHIGGFTPFNYEITSLLKEKGNSLVVKADDKRHADGVPTLNTDWWNYGGITRDVRIIEVPSTFIEDYLVQLKKGAGNEIAGYVQLNGKNSQNEVTLEIPGLKIKKTLQPDSTGKAIFDFKVRKIEKWCPRDPKLYKVVLSEGGQSVVDEIGFRTIETKGTQILLNGKPIFLRGISIHSENPLRGGRAYSESDAEMLLNSAKELNCNYVRLAHYAHPENMLRKADQMGILVWEENPVYWTIEWNNPATFANAENQLTEEITRDKNRACTIIWSMGNETPVSKARNEFLEKLAAKARSLDNTRLISAALETHTDPHNPYIKIVKDPFANYVDVVSFNEYIGWYDGTPEKCDSIIWKIPYNKPVLISEFGAGALQGYHGNKTYRFTEEYQKAVYVHTLKMISKIEQLRGFTPWILYDFRSPRRLLPNIQDGWNRKGLIGQNGVKKEAFYVLQKYYKEKEEESLKKK